MRPLSVRIKPTTQPAARARASSAAAEGLLLVRARLDLGVGDGVEEEVVGARVVVLGALRPVVRDGVREDVALAVEGADGDRRARLVELLEPLARLLVPKVEGAVGAGGGERAEGRVEGDAVDRVNVVVLAVALEREVLRLVLLVDVLDGDAAWSGGNWRSASSVAKCAENCAEVRRELRRIAPRIARAAHPRSTRGRSPAGRGSTRRSGTGT